MAPGHVAYGLGAQYGLRITAETVLAWERGVALPDERELKALAGVLWCAPGELLSEASTLREHRVARGMSPEDLARAVGMAPAAYLRIEESGRWRGNERQASALCTALDLSAAQFLTATGRNEELAELLNRAVTTRWQAYVKPVAKLVPLDRVLVEDVLAQLHADYQALTVSTLSWSSTGRDAAGAEGGTGQDFLDRVVEQFWRTAGL
ncbi:MULTISPECIES: helix-turn-helix domain-containing protein [Streptomyces]|uniref:Helix-turn-helix transcriptional regulator n=1 Tax=Streptomyces halstedii TaxID=1944 RepID=A0A6N9U353_STRHA|nr:MULTISPECIES: helix-turn-helix transcriptional regulator [Streptomyces]AWL40653.1 XRE family transcriptional regulator [Streptomyces sp. SM18]MBV7671049.1 helix-turn-helix transcriptional regulator [Streptomyces halstedii]NEA18078.1 helix-turn-helix transcriptional regulator [Streptomyces halstedii]